MAQFRSAFFVGFAFLLMSGTFALAQSPSVAGFGEGAVVPVGPLGQPDGDDGGFILPDEPDGYSAPATPPTTQTPGAGDPMSAARTALRSACLSMGGTEAYCSGSQLDAGAAELVQVCVNDPGKCCGDLKAPLAEQILGAPGACGY